MRLVRHVIDGAETEARDGRRFFAVDPWTRGPWAEVCLGDREDAARAVLAVCRRLAIPVVPRGAVHAICNAGRDAAEVLLGYSSAAREFALAGE